MSQGVGVVGLYVRDQDEALQFYVEKLGFRVHTDAKNGAYRWLTVQQVAADAGIDFFTLKPVLRARRYDPPDHRLDSVPADQLDRRDYVSIPAAEHSDRCIVAPLSLSNQSPAGKGLVAHALV